MGRRKRRGDARREVSPVLEGYFFFPTGFLSSQFWTPADRVVSREDSSLLTVVTPSFLRVEGGNVTTAVQSVQVDSKVNENVGWDQVLKLKLSIGSLNLSIVA